GVRLGGAIVYRAILRAGDRFQVGRVGVAIAERPGAAPVSTLALVRAGATAALERARPHVAELVRVMADGKPASRPRRIALFAGAVALLGMVCTTRVKVEAPCEIAPQARAWVRAPVAGFVREVHVR